MINRTFLVGNITRDSELRSTQGGMAILGFSIAVNDRRKNPQTGEWEEIPGYYDCVLFGNRAQALSQYLVKGTKVAVEGKLRWSSWEDKNTGQKRSKIEVIVDEIEFLSQRNQNGPQSAPQPGYGPQTRQGYPSATQPQMAPQMAPQRPQAAPQGYAAPAYQPTIPQQQDIYVGDSDIPF